MLTRSTLLATDPRFPASLREVADPPASIRLAGELPPLERAVAIVGTRRASEEAIDFTRTLARELALAGCAIVSGGALGIDGAAHLGALEGGGRTLVALAGGLDELFPPRHV